MLRTALTAILLIGVASSGALAQNAEDAIRQQVDTFVSTFNAGDGKALGDLYTEDAIVLPPGSAMVEGRQAIGEFWQGAVDAGLKDLALAPAEIVAQGDAAYEVGTLQLSAPGEGGEPQAVEGKYVVVWQKGADGTWRLHRDIWNLTGSE